MRVLVLGGYGVFGARVARLLAEDGHAITVAGRSLDKARDLAEEIGGAALRLDISDKGALSAALSGGDVVIDAAGPFQAYDDAMRVPRAAIEAGVHYLDLSDDAGFSTAISDLNDAAKDAGVTLLSGVSSVPAISGAAATWATGGMGEVGLIRSAILPGNRAPRGLSVVSAILRQAGEPVPFWRGGEMRPVPGWCGSRTVELDEGLARPAAPIGAPDLALFPGAFAARSVHFRAGLELPMLHYGLSALANLRRIGLLPRLDAFTRPMRWIASLFEGAGTDRGGMIVQALGRLRDGRPVCRSWTLIAEAGDGPWIPAIPARIAVRKLADGTIEPGARPAHLALSLDDVDAALSEFAISMHREERPAPRLFEAALGDAWTKISPEQRRLHDIWDMESFSGRASVERGNSLPARIVAALFGFPPARPDTPVRVTMERADGRETWVRDFDGYRFRSVLSPAGPGELHERFGPFRFRLALPVEDGRMSMVVKDGRFFGVPLPRVLLPRSAAIESVADGRFAFDVRIDLPFGGMLAHYRGWLVPDAA